MTSEGYVLNGGEGAATGLPEDLVDEVASVLEWYGCDMGQLTKDAAARAILQARAWELRRAADEALHAKRRDDALRLADLGRATQRAHIHATLRGIRGAMAESFSKARQS